MTWRRFLVQAHLWLGLTLGLVWALQGLTGALLVFHRDIELAGVAAAPGAMAPIDRIVAAAEARTGAPLSMINVADARGTVLIASSRGPGGSREARVEASTGRVIDAHAGEDGWRTIYELHEELLLHDRGKTLVGLSGLVLVSAALTGLWLGWPRRGSWRQAFAPGAWRTTRQRLYGWHRMAGLLVAAALVIVPLAGAPMALGSTLRPWLARHAGYQMPPKLDGPVPTEMVPAGVALAAARARFPDAAFVRLTFPGKRLPAYSVRLRQPGEVRAWSGTTSVTVDPASGRVIATYDALKAPLANRLFDAAFPVHNGEIGGVVGRVLVMLAGLALPTLYVTGLLAWWRKRRVSRRTSAPSSLPGSAPPSPA